MQTNDKVITSHVFYGVSLFIQLGVVTGQVERIP